MVLAVIFEFGRTADGSIPKDPATSTPAKKGTATEQNLVVGAQRDEDRGELGAWQKKIQRQRKCEDICKANPRGDGCCWNPKGNTHYPITNVILGPWAAACEKKEATIHEPPESKKEVGTTPPPAQIGGELFAMMHQSSLQQRKWELEDRRREKKEEEEKAQWAYAYAMQHKIPYNLNAIPFPPRYFPPSDPHRPCPPLLSILLGQRRMLLSQRDPKMAEFDGEGLAAELEADLTMWGGELDAAEKSKELEG
ncbi:MAG: hypothetical protein Q9210_004772 [Variospora velana]